ncbi:MAG: hypothetical protein A2W21_10260 [Betaproteobacteria bacterium RBG_16_66_20]|nr:MAG: hypothetical protein A2W21_10260 [Betaproteobacteria bacterium RBG_16_66_20]
MRLAMDMRHDACFGLGQRFEDLGHQRSKYLDIVAWGVNDDDSDNETGEILLILQITIDGQQNVKPRCRKLQKRAVLDASPPGFSNSLDFVARKLRA